MPEQINVPDSLCFSNKFSSVVSKKLRSHLETFAGIIHNIRTVIAIIQLVLFEEKGVSIVLNVT